MKQPFRGNKVQISHSRNENGKIREETSCPALSNQGPSSDLPG